MRITYKETIWREVNIPEENVDDVLSLLKEIDGTIEVAADLFDQLDFDCEHELIPETSTEIKPFFCNDGYSTVEIYDDNENLIFANGL